MVYYIIYIIRDARNVMPAYKRHIQYLHPNDERKQSQVRKLPLPVI